MKRHAWHNDECTRCGVMRFGVEYVYASSRVGWRKTKRKPACPPKDKVRR